MSWYLMPSGQPWYVDGTGTSAQVLLDRGATPLADVAVAAAITAYLASQPPAAALHGLVKSVEGFFADAGGNVDLPDTAAGVASVNGRAGVVTLTRADVGLDQASNTSDAAKPVSTATAAALSTKADLINGVVPSSQLAPIAINHGTITVANAAARYALVLGTTVQVGQPVVQASTGQTFILADGATDASQVASWTEIAAIGKVQTVNGQTGAVVLGAADVGAPTAQALTDETSRAKNAELARVPVLPPLASVSATTALTKDKTQLVDATSGAITLTTLPTLVSSSVGDTYAFQKTDSSLNVVVAPFANGDTTLGGNPSAELRMAGVITLQVVANPAGAKVWRVLNHVRADSAMDGRYARIAESINTVAASGAALTLPDVTVATMHDITLTGNTTVTLPPLGAGKSFTMRLTQDATGGRVPTFVAADGSTVRWPQGVAPALSAVGGKADIVTFVTFTGGNWTGMVAALDVR